MTVAATRLPGFEALWSTAAALGPAEDAPSAAYGGTLRFPQRVDRPTVIVNFVSTLDGVVSYGVPGAAGGSAISGSFGPDRFLMGYLRAHADAVLVGAGTVRGASDERWTPGDVYPAAAAELAEVRRARGLAAQPTTVVMTRSGRLDPGHPGLSDPAIPVLIASPGGVRPPAPLPPNVEVMEASSVGDLMAALSARGVRLLLCEGGPHLLAQLLAAEAVDELFLTLAPQVAGRSPAVGRLGLVEGVGFDVDTAPWWRLISVARVDDHLFLRYRRTS